MVSPYLSTRRDENPTGFFDRTSIDVPIAKRSAIQPQVIVVLARSLLAILIFSVSVFRRCSNSAKLQPRRAISSPSRCVGPCPRLIQSVPSLRDAYIVWHHRSPLKCAVEKGGEQGIQWWVQATPASFLQILRNCGELFERGFQVIGDFLRDDFGRRQVGAFFQCFVFQPKNVQVHLVALDQIVVTEALESLGLDALVPRPCRPAALSRRSFSFTLSASTGERAGVVPSICPTSVLAWSAARQEVHRGAR